MILLIIPNVEKKAGIILQQNNYLHGITSKHKGDFYCLNWLHSFRTKKKLMFDEKVCKKKDFCGIVMPSRKNNILKLNQYMKSDKNVILYLCWTWIFD